ncbi:MAG: hypothetical protein AB1489_05015 [Acidobacteriota bacterium]
MVALSESPSARQKRLDTQKLLVELFRTRFEQARAAGHTNLDLLVIAIEIGCDNLNQIGLAARQLVAELGDSVELEATVWGVILKIKL